MEHRSLITRSLRAGWVRLAGAALLVGAVAGCQSNSDRDLIARERRMQEDQIYSLQDYINQYQQLVCRYRSENCSLRQQLSEGFVAPTQPSETEPHRDNRATNRSPRFQPPATPGVKQKPAGPPPSPPPLDTPDVPPLDTPDVPPLKTSSNAEVDSGIAAQAVESETPVDSSPRVVTASYEEPLLQPISPPVAETVAKVPPAAVAPKNEIMLAGEVVANPAGGPRLMVDVVPFDGSGRVAAVDGTVSLMLLTPGDDGRQQSVGRWDFTPEEVRAAIAPAASEPTMRFFVELPSGTNVNQSIELWARIVPREGSKTLAHAAIDLTRPGTFSSRANKVWPAEEAVVAANHEEPMAPETPATEVVETVGALNQGPWAIAMPGKPANLPSEVADTSGGGGWRVSSEPIPAAVATSVEVPQRPLAERPMKEHLAKERPERKADITPVSATVVAPVQQPSWAPNRSDEPSQRVATRPSWSATR